LEGGDLVRKSKVPFVW